MNFERITPIRFDEIDSTNAEAMRMLKRSKPIEGTCVVADYQLEGRGQRSNAWYSRPGENLLVSFILYPPSHLTQQPFLLSKAIAIAVRNTLGCFAVGNVQIKWPNDILIDGKKAAGILLENQWAGTNWQASIAGIGINVNQTEFALERATSLAICADKSTSVDVVLIELQRRLSQEYARLCNGSDKNIDDNYHQLLFGTEEYYLYQTSDGNLKAKIVRVVEDGRLELVTEKGEIYSYDLSEIKLVY
jgi:BirA family biotin operon repressor/biotin-[acetyl-CoA-carboxylase] ligase